MIREVLKQYRLANGKTQRQMAEKYGVCHQAWFQWENGVTTPRPHMMARLAKDIGFPVSDIFPDVFMGKDSNRNCK